jgi:hypothetical protein
MGLSDGRSTKIRGCTIIVALHPVFPVSIAAHHFVPKPLDVVVDGMQNHCFAAVSIVSIVFLNYFFFKLK